MKSAASKTVSFSREKIEGTVPGPSEGNAGAFSGGGKLNLQLK
jgi:hypothetical protein